VQPCAFVAFRVGPANRHVITITYDLKLDNLTYNRYFVGHDDHISLFRSDMQINLNAGEYVVQVLGTHGQGANVADLIRSLKFITNKTTYGPYGNPSGGTSFASYREGRVVGFFGRSGDLLDQLGVIVAPIILKA
jgi:hypothetical protein